MFHLLIMYLNEVVKCTAFSQMTQNKSERFYKRLKCVNCTAFWRDFKLVGSEKKKSFKFEVVIMQLLCSFLRRSYNAGTLLMNFTQKTRGLSSAGWTAIRWKIPKGLFCNKLQELQLKKTKLFTTSGKGRGSFQQLSTLWSVAYVPGLDE